MIAHRYPGTLFRWPDPGSRLVGGRALRFVPHVSRKNDEVEISWPSSSSSSRPPADEEEERR